MSQETLEAVFNNKKEKIIHYLKKEGEYVNCSQEYGYIYKIVQVIRGEKLLFTLGLKAGKIHVVDMKLSYMA